LWRQAGFFSRRWPSGRKAASKGRLPPKLAAPQLVYRNQETGLECLPGYPVVRWSEVSEIEVVLLNRPEIAPSGAGEPSSRPTAAAINNAVFDATDVRIRTVPLTPSRVKAACSSRLLKKSFDRRKRLSHLAGTA
jgi:hypothetical protein